MGSSESCWDSPAQKALRGWDTTWAVTATETQTLLMPGMSLGQTCELHILLPEGPRESWKIGKDLQDHQSPTFD